MTQTVRIHNYEFVSRTQTSGTRRTIVAHEKVSIRQYHVGAIQARSAPGLCQLSDYMQSYVTAEDNSNIRRIIPHFDLTTTKNAPPSAPVRQQKQPRELSRARVIGEAVVF